MPNSHPFLAEDFLIRWSTLTPEHVEPDVTEAIAAARSTLDTIKSTPDAEVDFANTFGALEAASDSLERAWGRLNHLDSVSNNDAQREALNPSARA